MSANTSKQVKSYKVRFPKSDDGSNSVDRRQSMKVTNSEPARTVTIDDDKDNQNTELSLDKLVSEWRSQTENQTISIPIQLPLTVDEQLTTVGMLPWEYSHLVDVDFNVKRFPKAPIATANWFYYDSQRSFGIIIGSTPSEEDMDVLLMAGVNVVINVTTKRESRQYRTLEHLANAWHFVLADKIRVNLPPDLKKVSHQPTLSPSQKRAEIAPILRQRKCRIDGLMYIYTFLNCVLCTEGIANKIFYINCIGGQDRAILLASFMYAMATHDINVDRIMHRINITFHQREVVRRGELPDIPIVHWCHKRVIEEIANLPRLFLFP